MSNIAEKIREAAKNLAATDDNDWTGQGLPNVGRIQDLTGDKSIMRADIDAAMPGFSRTVIEVPSVQKEQNENTETKTQAQNEPEETDPTTTPDIPVDDPEADHEIGQKGQDWPLDDGGDDESVDMTGDMFMLRGLLMSLIMRLPHAMRVIAAPIMLEKVFDFVCTWDEREVRIVVCELIKSIIETHPEEIANGLYQERIRVAMSAVFQENAPSDAPKLAADDQKAAAARLAKVTGGAGAVPGQQQPSALDGNDDQNEAHNRLYGGVTDGVRSADE